MLFIAFNVMFILMLWVIELREIEINCEFLGLLLFPMIEKDSCNINMF